MEKQKLARSIISVTNVSNFMLFHSVKVIREFLALKIYYRQHNKADFSYQEFGQRIRKSFERLGPVYIKLGQMLSMRPDFLPKEICIELEDLLDSAPQLSYKDIKQTINNLPFEVEAKPIASASLSQVHKGVLDSGEKVAIKILRPNIKKTIKKDIKFLRNSVYLFHYFLPIKKAKDDIIRLIDELESWLDQELDYRLEAEHMMAMSKELSDVPQVQVPMVYKDLSSESVLVMEYIDGYSVIDLIRLRRINKLPKLSFSLETLVKNLVDYIGIDSLNRAHFHADMHPANIIVQKDGTIYLLDFGLVKFFDIQTRKNIAIFMLGATLASPELIILAGKRMAKFGEDYDEQKVLRVLSEICENYKDAPASKVSNGQFLVSIIDICLKNEVEFPWLLTLYTRSALHLDGITLNLHPEFIFSNHSKNRFLKIYSDFVIKEVVSIPSVVEKIEKFLATMAKKEI